ncbi:transposase DNA-binding-containing protein [Pedobacter jamesrossensis]|uniref:transposase DNA-binding-containing protein n=1 Tax=Pedobacter jamesrossensis TaxID=1908238 RepID=UPI0036148302
MQREFTDLRDHRLLFRGNKILMIFLVVAFHSIRQLTDDEASAKGFYRFLQNDRVSESNILSNLVGNCRSACSGKYFFVFRTPPRLI